MKNLAVQILKWNDVRLDVKKINPQLFKLIEETDTNDKYEFIKARYKYGQFIVKNGSLHLPLGSDKEISIDDKQVPKEIRKKLNYSSVPIGLIMSKTSEIYYESPTRVMPTKLYQTGAMFGLWEAFDPPPSKYVKHVWNIRAGARSIFMLPKISNQSQHSKLQKYYSFNQGQPKNILDQHDIFSKIVNSHAVDNKWYCDILFFSEKLNPDNLSNQQFNLKYFLLKEAWHQSFNCRNNMSFDMAWELFSQSVTEKNFKPKPLIINTIKHLMLIKESIYPGFAPALSDDCAPINLITEAYLDIYRIQNYPTIMVPVHISKKNRPVYYSLQLPSLIEYAPGSQGKNVITDLRELKRLIDTLKEIIDIDINFDFYHSEKDSYLGITHAKELADSDKNMRPKINKYNLPFSDNSPFLKGCIQISLNQDRSNPLITQSSSLKNKK